MLGANQALRIMLTQATLIIEHADRSVSSKDFFSFSDAKKEAKRLINKAGVACVTCVNNSLDEIKWWITAEDKEFKY